MNIDTQYLLHLLVKALDARAEKLEGGPQSDMNVIRAAVMRDLRAVLDATLDASVESGTQGGTVVRDNRGSLPLRQHASAVVLSRNAEGRLGVWLSKRLEPGRFQGCWQCPGGRVRKHESAQEAAARALYEETWLAVELGQLNFLRVAMSEHYDYAMHLSHYGLVLETPPVLKNTELGLRTDWEWFRLDEVPKDLTPGLAEVLATAEAAVGRMSKEAAHA